MPESPSLPWTFRLTAEPAGLSLAREAGWSLVWDRHGWVILLDPFGHVQGRHHHPRPITSAAIADGATAFVVADETGFTRFTLDIRSGERVASPNSILAITLDVGGDFCMTSDANGRLALWDRAGSLVREWESPRSVKYLALASTCPHAVVAAEFGFCGRLDLTSGQWLWRDRPVVHVGSLSIDGSGDRVALACFSESIRFLDGQGHQTLPPAKLPGCRSASLSADQRWLAVVDMEHRASLVELRDGRRRNLPTNFPVSFARLSGRADVIWLAGADSASALALT